MDDRELEKLRETGDDGREITAEDRKKAGKKFNFWVSGMRGVLHQKGAAAFP